MSKGKPRKLPESISGHAKSEAKNATINRELAFLKRAFQLGYDATPPKVYRVPSFPSLEENNVRKGFLKDEQYEALAKACAKEGLWLRALLAVAYNFGWRRGELVNLRVRQIDLASRTIRLEVGETKNGEGRLVKMTDEVYTLIAACVQGKSADDFVFTREDGAPSATSGSYGRTSANRPVCQGCFCTICVELACGTFAGSALRSR